MKATDAKKLTTECRENQIAKILSEIEEMAKIGCFCLWVRNPSSASIEMLMSLGYSLDRFGAKELMKISWGSEDE